MNAVDQQRVISSSTPPSFVGAEPTVLPSITSFTGATASDLPYLATVDLTPGTGIPFFIRLAATGQMIAVYLDAGAADGTDPAQVAPLDYNALTNSVHWTRAL